ncbi:HATPase_MORC-like domain containing protein [Candidatus Methylopumilus universalis]|uniref:ATP-binding protein n=1 Tax=Candidatus Methylopumilus universalis TaxID=2588536 RepID=UPI003BEEEA30
MGVKPFSAGHTLESLRDSDFDSCSAFGEVVDNSLQANAENIRIHFEPKGIDGIEKVIFMDDGEGMSPEILQNCLRLGWSSRYNDRTGIGRFGVGMTLGAIHECRRVEVYSKPKGGEWRHTFLDLDDIELADLENKEWEIPSPTKLSPSDKVPQQYIPGDQGTILIWSKYDRARDKRKDLIEELRVWLGRTFRYYIWNESLDGKTPLRNKPVNLFLDGVEIKAIDPLYVRTEKTNFPDDPKAFEFDKKTFSWPINDPKIAEQLGTDNSEVTIRMSLLPEEFRSYQGAGGSSETNKRYIDQNEGFSFLRHGREVGYDWIPHFQFQGKEIDRWWGCEIHFNASLDRAFTVKNIKRGAVPSTELKRTLAKALAGWINTMREKASDDFKKNREAKEPEGALPKGTEGHTLTGKIAQKAALPQGKIASGKNHEEEIKKAAQQYGDNDPEEIARLKAIFSSQPFTVGEKGWQGSTFIDIVNMGGSDAMFYNNRHIFFDVLNTIKAELKDGINIDGNIQRLAVLMDILLISYAKSESMLNPKDQMQAIDFIDLLKNNWGLFLKTYISTWQGEYDSGIAS